MSKIRALAGQTLIYGLGTVVPRLLNYALLTPFYTRVFIKGEYGSVTILYSYVAFLLVALTYGMETTFFRFSESEKNHSKVFSTASLSVIFTTIPFIFMVLFFNQGIADWIGYQSNPEYITWLGIIVSLDVLFAIPFAKLRQENKAVLFTSIKLINILVNISLNFFFLKVLREAYLENPDSFLGTMYNPNINVGYVLIANIAASFITATLLLPQYFKVKLTFNKALWKRMIIYTFPLLVVGLASMINEVADKILLERLLGENSEDVVGIYAANYKLALLMTIFIQMFRYAAEPFFFKNAQEKNAKSTYATVMKYFIIFGLSIFLGITLMIDQVVLFIGSEYREGVKVVPIVLLANLFLGIYYNLSVWYKLTNKTYFGAIIAVIGAIITIILNVMLIPKFGYMASAWATFSAYGGMMLISWAWGRKFYKIDYPIFRILAYFALSLLLYFTFQQLNIQSEILKFGTGVAFMLTFLSVSIFMERKELKLT